MSYAVPTVLATRHDLAVPVGYPCRLCGRPIATGRDPYALRTDDGAWIHAICPARRTEVA